MPGLEHSLSWRPSGSLIAGTQRFGRVPGADPSEEGGLGQGRDGRHDVVFFERNGLKQEVSVLSNDELFQLYHVGNFVEEVAQWQSRAYAIRSCESGRGSEFCRS